MNEENLSPEGEAVEVETRVQLSSVDENVNISEAKALRLTVEGETPILLGLFEMVMAFLQIGLGGEVARAENSEGDDITNQFRPAVIDPFDLGDDPVA